MFNILPMNIGTIRNKIKRPYFFLKNTRQVLFQGGYHGRCLWLGSFNVQSKTGIFNGAGCIATKSANTCTILLKPWTVIKEAFYTAGVKNK